MTSLRRVDAEARAAVLTVHGYVIALDLTTGDERFASTTTVRFGCREDGASTFLDVAAVDLVSVRLNGAEVDVSGYRAGDTRILLTDLAVDNELVVDAVMAYSHDGEGLHRNVDPADGLAYLYVTSFLDAAPRWFACFDQPDLKAPVAIDITCPPEWTVAGNGPATSSAPGRWHIAASGPLATYFTALIAGPYHEVRGEHDGIPLVLHCRASLARHLDADAEGLLEHTARFFDELHRLFGHRYPWGEYHQAFVPEFNAGAMENAGCVTITESLLFRGPVTDADRVERLVTIAHEMAHMWFGDLVTMRWWDDLWLNESFAEYLGQRVVGDQAWVMFGARRKTWGYAADRRPSTHPVAGNDAADAAAALNAFDGISYAKGASVLRQLAGYLGDEVFLAGLRSYIATHAHGNATFADLAAAWEAASGRDLGPWLEAWLRTTGLDTIAVDDGSLTRTGSRPHAVTVGAYAPDGTQLARVPLTLDSDIVACPVPGGAALVVPDSLDDTWAKAALSPSAWSAAASVLPQIDDGRTRVSLWEALQLAVADADLDPARALDVVVAGLPAEHDTVVAPMARWSLRALLGTYVADADRPAALDAYAQAFRAALDNAAPGSDRQLTAARQVIASGDPLLPWLDGRDVPEGLVVDQDLRWSIVLAAVRHGAAGADLIDAEATADASTQGAEHAARCRAALPSAAAKAAAWETLVADGHRSSTELYAIGTGFWDPSQRELTNAYAHEYAVHIGDTARLRSGIVVGQLARLAFPWTAVDAGVVAAMDALIADPDVDVAIRRSVIDGTDDLRRAVAVRARFGS